MAERAAQMTDDVLEMAARPWIAPRPAGLDRSMAFDTPHRAPPIQPKSLIDRYRPPNLPALRLVAHLADRHRLA
jgi:hypothetical protein